jgi:hypothetical protein
MNNLEAVLVEVHKVRLEMGLRGTPMGHLVVGKVW